MRIAYSDAHQGHAGAKEMRYACACRGVDSPHQHSDHRVSSFGGITEPKTVTTHEQLHPFHH